MDAAWQGRIAEGFVWTKQTGTIGLGGLPDVNPDLVTYLSKPAAATADGAVVVGQAVTADYDGVAFRWTASEGMEVIATHFAEPVALSADGAVVLGKQTFGELPSHRVFRWTREGGAVDIALTPGQPVEPLDLSADGSTVLAESNRQIFVWTERTGAEPIELAPGLHGCTQGSVTRTSWRLSSEMSYGHVAGGTCINAADQLEPFVWSAQQGMVGLGTLDGYELDELFAVSEDGSVAVGLAKNDVGAALLVPHPFRWTETQGLRLLELPAGREFGGLLGGRWSMSRDGSIVVGWLFDTVGGPAVGSYRWSEATGPVELLPLAGYDRAEVHALSADGSVAAGTSYIHEDEVRSFATAVVWYADGVAHRVTDQLGLPIDDGLLQIAERVSSNGTLVGSGLTASARLLWHASPAASSP
jgi:uncharacterized membrane protein